MRILKCAAWVFFVLLGCKSAYARGELAELPTKAATPAGDSMGTSEPAVGLFERGRYEFNFSNGVLFSPFLATGHRPTINYTMTEVQFGYMLTEVRGTGWLRGNVELAGEGFASRIFDGDGSFIAGGTLWGRYNFVQPACRFVPYGQVGLGMVSTDISHRIVGQPFNFNIEVGLGTRYLLNEHWAVGLELRYQHISNADSGRHNLGINALGPILGVSYLF